jgi:hypothetical protein
MSTHGSGLNFPDAAVNLTGATYTDGKHYPLFDGVKCICMGAACAAGGAPADGILMVHSLRGGNFPLPLTGGALPTGYMFDYIVETGTTIDLTKTYVFPKA